MVNSLITIIVTNLVLYGISETLAQTILCYDPMAPKMSFTISDSTTLPQFAPHVPYLPGEAALNTAQSSSRNASSPTTLVNPFSGSEQGLTLPDSDSDVDEENLDRFIDYLRQSDTELPLAGVSATTPASPSRKPLSYFKFNRLAGFMCWGFLMAFVQCWWYKFLQIYSKHPQFVEVLRKVMSDQFCFSPISLFCFFTYGTMVLESGSWEDTVDKLKKLYLQTLMINYCVWFPVQFINFLLVPRSLQVPFSSSISVLWNCFLSIRNSSE